MMSASPDQILTEQNPHLLQILSRLHEIGAAVRSISPGDDTCLTATLRLVASSLADGLPGASVVICTYDPACAEFDPDSSIAVGEHASALSANLLRADDLGARALQARRLMAADEPENATMVVPLQVADQALGVLGLQLDMARPLSEGERLLLEVLADQAAIAIYQARRLTAVQRDLARKENELSRLRRAGLLISSQLRLEETLEAILRMALEVTDAEYGIFRLVDKSGRNLITRAVAGEMLAKPRTEVLPIDSNSIMGWVAERRQPVCIRDLQVEPWSRIYYPLDSNLRMRAELAVPLISASGRLEGVVNLESPHVDAFSEEDSHLLQALATQAVIAIQEARLLDALQEVAAYLLTRPCQEVLSRVVELACDLLNAAASAIWTVEGDELVLQAASAGYEHGERLPLRGSLTGQVVLTGEVVTADDVRDDPRFHRRDLAQAQGWSRALIIPLLASTDSKPIGAFSVYSAGPIPGRFVESEWDKKVLTCLAHYAALAVHNAARQEALRVAQGQHAIAETFAAVGDIAANLLHQLNNKVGTIPVRVQGIQDKCGAALAVDPYLATNLAEIERSASEAMEVVRENLAHLNPIHLAPVDVAACVSAAVQAVRLEADITLHIEDVADLPPVMAGQRSLTLVFANLLENASDAMGGHGTVTIRGAAIGNWVEVSVADDGPGVAPELHERIFDLAYSGRRSRAGKLGFGLWWVRTLMTRLGGSVTVESDGRHGSTFRIRLPRAETEL